MPGHGHAQGACEGLEDRLGLVVLVFAAGRDLEVAARRRAERVEEVAEQLGGNVPDPLAPEFGLPLEIDAPAEVEEHQRPAVVHRQGESVAGDAGLGAQRPVDRLAQRDGHILHGVVLVNVEVAVSLHREGHASVVGDLLGIRPIISLNDGISKVEAKVRGDAAVPPLTSMEAEVILNKATEAPWTGKYENSKAAGTYLCRQCGVALYRSKDKFDSGCGWPAFTKPLARRAVKEKRDQSFGMERTEVRSREADSHLGHVFTDGPQERGGLRYCINSAALRFIPADQLEAAGYGEYVRLFKQ